VAWVRERLQGDHARARVHAAHGTAGQDVRAGGEVPFILFGTFFLPFQPPPEGPPQLFRISFFYLSSPRLPNLEI